MKIWLDAQLPPTLAPWMRDTFGVDAMAVRDLGLRDAADGAIFTAAKAAGAVLVTKDADFLELVERHGIPPAIVWVTCGNVGNRELRTLLGAVWPKIAALLDAGEPVVELSKAA